MEGVEEEERRDVGAGRAETPPVVDLSEEEVTVRGPVAAGVRAKPIEGGRAVGLAVVAAEDLGFSLSHEEKKSSSAVVGVDAAARGVSSRPSIWIPWGFLEVS